MSPMDFATIFGTFGALFSITSLLPELALALRTHHLNDISWGMLGILELNFLSWFMYGILEPAHFITLAASINILVTTSLISLKFYFSYPHAKHAYQLARAKGKRPLSKSGKKNKRNRDRA